MIKKIIGMFFVFGFLFVASTASASITFDPVSPSDEGTTVTPTCDALNVTDIYIYDASENYISHNTCDGVTAVSGDFVTAVEMNCSNVPLGADCSGDNSTLTSVRLTAPSYLSSEATYIFEVVVAPVGLYATGIFFERTELGGDVDADALIASVGTVTGSTFGSLGPILAVIGGILLAFIAIKYIVSLLNETNPNKKGKRRI